LKRRVGAFNGEEVGVVMEEEEVEGARERIFFILLSNLDHLMINKGVRFKGFKCMIIYL